MKGRHGLRIGSLFAGVGGLELGLEWAGVGHVVWQVELEPYARGVLAKHWPDADRSVADVRDGGRATLTPVDLICGGFPCQDVSYAGKGEGLDGARSGLWSEYRRIIGELRPRFVVVENVAALLTRGMGRVLGDLSELGYDAEWTTLRASDVGAPHRRERIFIVAHAVREGREGPVREASAGRTGSLERGDEVADADRVRRERSTGGGRQAIDGPQHASAEGVADADERGPRGEHDRSRRQEEARAGFDGDAHGSCAGMADAARCGLAERRGDVLPWRGKPHAPRRGAAVADADRRGCEVVGLEESPRVRSAPRREPHRCRRTNAGFRRWCRVAHATSGGLGELWSAPRCPRYAHLGGTCVVADAERDAVRASEDGHGRRRGETEPRDASAIEGDAAESRLGGDLDGLPDRVDVWPAGPGEEPHAWEPPRAIPSKTDRNRRPRLKALGNSVVPQCACVVGLHVRELIEKHPTRLETVDE